MKNRYSDNSSSTINEPVSVDYFTFGSGEVDEVANYKKAKGYTDNSLKNNTKSNLSKYFSALVVVLILFFGMGLSDTLYQFVTQSKVINNNEEEYSIVEADSVENILNNTNNLDIFKIKSQKPIEVKKDDLSDFKIYNLDDKNVNVNELEFALENGTSYKGQFYDNTFVGALTDQKTSEIYSLQIGKSYLGKEDVPTGIIVSIYKDGADSQGEVPKVILLDFIYD